MNDYIHKPLNKFWFNHVSKTKPDIAKKMLIFRSIHFQADITPPTHTHTTRTLPFICYSNIPKVKNKTQNMILSMSALVNHRSVTHPSILLKCNPWAILKSNQALQCSFISEFLWTEVNRTKSKFCTFLSVSRIKYSKIKHLCSSRGDFSEVFACTVDIAHFA